MNILITGGTGLIGSALCQSLLSKQHSLIVLTRSPKKAALKLTGDIRFIRSLNEILCDESIHAVINLAGEPIADKRWTPERKKQIEDSRILLTSNLLQLFKKLNTEPRVLISGSAIGYYGDGKDNIITEHSEPNDEFSHQLCAAWEMQALRAKALGMRVCIVRTGVVIAKDGGMIKKLLPTFRLGLGAQLGDGSQWLSWIHLSDMVKLIIFLLENDTYNGIFNATSPNPITNKEFTSAFAKVLHRPALLKFSPSFLRLIFGEMSHILLTGQRVIPKKLSGLGFQFQYPNIGSALDQVMEKNGNP